MRIANCPSSGGIPLVLCPEACGSCSTAAERCPPPGHRQDPRSRGKGKGFLCTAATTQLPLKYHVLPSWGTLPIASWQAPSHAPKNILWPVIKPNVQPGPNDRGQQLCSPPHSACSQEGENLFSANMGIFTRAMLFSRQPLFLNLSIGYSKTPKSMFKVLLLTLKVLNNISPVVF